MKGVELTSPSLDLATQMRSFRKGNPFLFDIDIYSWLILFTNSRDKMLKPEDVAVSVWESVDKPANVHVNDILIRDAIQ